MPAKRIAIVCRTRDTVYLKPVAVLLTNEGFSTEVFNEIPDMSDLDLLMVYGFGDDKNDKFFHQVKEAALKHVPCLYIYTNTDPELPGVTSLESLFRYKVLLDTINLLI